jgi:hypothetical protein
MRRTIPLRTLITLASRFALVAAACAFIGVYLYVAAARIAYPYEIEWMEGGSLEHVERILTGRPIYVKPSLDFIPYIYTPAYYYVAAAVSQITGIGFTPLRLVSFLASLVCFTLVFEFVRREGGSASCGVISAGLFAATFRLGGAWFDVARVDSLFMLFCWGRDYAEAVGNNGRSGACRDPRVPVVHDKAARGYSRCLSGACVSCHVAATNPSRVPSGFRWLGRPSRSQRST